MSKKNIIIYSIFALVFIACFVFYSILSKDKKYTDIIYHIEYPSDTLFTEKEFSQFVEKNCPRIIGKPIDSIDLQKLERKIETYPYISNADVINNKGKLIIKATQEKIIAKVFNSKNEQFYFADNGKLVPKSKNTAGRILVINGYIKERYSENYSVKNNFLAKNKDSILYIVWKMACFIENDPFWKAQITQIYVNESQELELIPTIGEQVILFGKVALTNNIDKVIKHKFNNLSSLYINGFKITGWDKYQSINHKDGTEIPCEIKSSQKP
jgi:cell division protein FtsQ